MSRVENARSQPRSPATVSLWSKTPDRTHTLVPDHRHGSKHVLWRNPVWARVPHESLAQHAALGKPTITESDEVACGSLRQDRDALESRTVRLDQGSALHQSFVEPRCKPLPTSLISPDHATATNAPPDARIAPPLTLSPDDAMLHSSPDYRQREWGQFEVRLETVFQLAPSVPVSTRLGPMCDY